MFQRRLSAFMVVCASCGTALAGVPVVWTSPDNGFGTATMPPTGSEYVSVGGVWNIIDGLPPATTIDMDATWRNFAAVTEGAGGSLGGTTSTYDSELFFPMVGTGSLAGFNRLITIPLPGGGGSQVSDFAPRMAFAPVQTFAGKLMRMQGQILGDPDFDLLRVTAGFDFGLPSPGQTQLSLLGSGMWNVDSFFDIVYRIDFVGAPGGALAGRSGSTTGTIRMQLGIPSPGALPLFAATGLLAARRRRTA